MNLLGVLYSPSENLKSSPKDFESDETSQMKDIDNLLSIENKFSSISDFGDGRANGEIIDYLTM